MPIIPEIPSDIPTLSQNLRDAFFGTECYVNAVLESIAKAWTTFDIRDLCRQTERQINSPCTPRQQIKGVAKGLKGPYSYS